MGCQWLGKGRIGALMKKIGCFVLTSLTFLIGTSFPSSAFVSAPRNPAERNMTQAMLNGYDETTWAKLMDNRLEYAEIDDLVHNFNPEISAAWKNYQDRRLEIIQNIDNLSAVKRNMDNLLEEAKTNEDVEEMAIYAAQSMGLKAVIDGMKKSKENLEKPISSSNASLRMAQAQMSASVRTLMINYKNLLLQKELLRQTIELSQTQLTAEQVKVRYGTGILSDVQKLQVDILQTQSRISELTSNELQMKRSLIQMCGWNPSANPEIGDVPQVDEQALSSLHPEIDIKKAIGNNYTLIEERHGKHPLNQTGRTAWETREAQMEANLHINLQELYQKVRDAKNSLDQARQGLENINAQLATAQVSYRLGAISQSQYAEIQIQQKQKELEISATKMNLLLAVNAYYDAVNGNAKVE